LGIGIYAERNGFGPGPPSVTEWFLCAASALAIPAVVLIFRLIVNICIKMRGRSRKHRAGAGSPEYSRTE
jgi:hypothetical protein